MDALPEFALVRATTLEEMIGVRARHPDSRLLGGGTDLVVNIRRGIVAPPVLIDVNDVAELRARTLTENRATLSSTVPSLSSFNASGRRSISPRSSNVAMTAAIACSKPS